MINHRFAVLAALTAVGSGCATPPPTAHSEPPAAFSSSVADLPGGSQFTPTATAHREPAAPRERAAAERTAPDAEFRQQRPKPAPERPFKVPEARRFKLPGGLPVIFVESHDLPLVSMSLVIKHGSGSNPPGQAGLAELTAGLLDEGTKNRSSTQISDEVEQLGASLSAYASWDASVVNVFAMSEVLDRALAVWADVLLNPAFPPAELERVKANVLAGIVRRKDSPPAVASVALARALYGDAHPYAWPGNGTEDSVKKLGVDDLRRFWETHYRPNAAVLVVAGDTTEDQLRTKLGPLLAAWKPRPVPAARIPKAPSLGATSVFLIDKPGAPQSSIRVGLVGVPRTTPDYHQLLVMNEILGGGFRRLDLELREKRGWTYGARANFDMRRAAGPWFAGGEFVANKTADSVEVLLHQIQAIRDVDVSDEELNEAKQSIIRAFPARFETTNQIASQLAALAVYDLPLEQLRSFPTRIGAVTKADVRRVAKKYLDSKHLAIVVVGDQQTNEGALKKIAQVQLRDLEGKPLAASTGKTADKSGDPNPAAVAPAGTKPPAPNAAPSRSSAPAKAPASSAAPAATRPAAERRAP